VRYRNRVVIGSRHRRHRRAAELLHQRQLRRCACGAKTWMRTPPSAGGCGARSA